MQLLQERSIDPDINDWEQYGSCRSLSTVTLDDFFFEGRFKKDSDNEHAHVNRLKAVCAACPVKQECDEFATRTKQEGFWAGLTEEDRRRRKQTLRKRAWIEKNLAHETAARKRRREQAKQREGMNREREMLELSFLPGSRRPAGHVSPQSADGARCDP